MQISCLQVLFKNGFTSGISPANIASRLAINSNVQYTTGQHETQETDIWSQLFPGSFDKAMFRIFGDIPFCLNQRADILIGGTTLEEHNKTYSSTKIKRLWNNTEQGQMPVWSTGNRILWIQVH